MTIDKAKQISERNNQEKLSIARSLQKDCHKYIEKLLAKDKTITYQDATNLWLFNKLAEMQVQLDKLNSFHSFHTRIE